MGTLEGIDYTDGNSKCIIPCRTDNLNLEWSTPSSHPLPPEIFGNLKIHFQLSPPSEPQPGITLNILHCTRALTTQNYLSPDVNSAKAACETYLYLPLDVCPLTLNSSIDSKMYRRNRFSMSLNFTVNKSMSFRVEWLVFKCQSIICVNSGCLLSCLNLSFFKYKTKGWPYFYVLWWRLNTSVTLRYKAVSTNEKDGSSCNNNAFVRLYWQTCMKFM